MVLTGLVLLIACANSANLVLGRHAARRASWPCAGSAGLRDRALLRQLFSESLVLAFFAGLAELVVTVWARQALWSLRPEIPARKNGGPFNHSAYTTRRNRRDHGGRRAASCSTRSAAVMCAIETLR